MAARNVRVDLEAPAGLQRSEGPPAPEIWLGRGGRRPERFLAATVVARSRCVRAPCQAGSCASKGRGTAFLLRRGPCPIGPLAGALARPEADGVAEFQDTEIGVGRGDHCGGSQAEFQEHGCIYD